MSEPDDARPADGEGATARDGELPRETLRALRDAWRVLPAPPPARELQDEDEATRRVVGWMAAAWKHPAVLAPPATEAPARPRAPEALRAAQRRLREGSRLRAPLLALAGWRRQVAAAAVLLVLLGAALQLAELARSAGVPADMRDASTAPPPAPGVADASPVHAPSVPIAGDAPAPLAPRLLATAGPPAPLELRAGNVHLLLFTDATRPIPENQP